MAKKTAAKKKPVVQKAKKAAKKAATKSRKPPVKAKKTAAAKAAPKAARKAKPRVKAKANVKLKVKARAALKAKVKAKVKAKAAKPVARKAAPKKVAARKRPARRPAKKAVPVKKAVPAKKAVPVKKAAPAKKAVPAAPPRKVPSLDRERRVVRESDLVPSPPSSLVPQRHASAASTGADELRVKLANHTSTGPEMTGGDVDADWQTAETSGDGAPGGNNPTPDQDVVEEIGKALGVQYDDDEELRGGEEIADRDHDRWELDPASSEDFEDR